MTHHRSVNKGRPLYRCALCGKARSAFGPGRTCRTCTSELIADRSRKPGEETLRDFRRRLYGS